MAIRNFADKATMDLAAGKNSARTRRLLPVSLHRGALKKLQILRAASRLEDLRQFPGLQLECLRGQRKNELSVRINEQYRICFKWVDGDAHDVSIEDYH